MRELKPFEFPLHGVRLIEASAGTGKTYTITSLFLRLLLEREQPLDRILVVTFTHAATEELRGRVRARLLDALQALRGDVPEGDGFLLTLCDRLTDRGDALRRVQDALQRMDESAVFTIHGFCQRTLKEHAFQSGVLFETEFLSSDAEMRRSIIEDFWRLEFGAVSEVRAHWVQDRWSGPAQLLAAIGAYAHHPHLTVVPDISEAQLDSLARARTGALHRIGDLWGSQHRGVCELLRDHKSLRRSQDTYRADRVEAAIEALQELLGATGDVELPEQLELFTRSKLDGSLKKNAAPVPHSFFDAFQVLWDADRKLQRLREVQILNAACDYLRTQLPLRKAAQGVLSFDDLLANLAQALERTTGEALASSIRDRYPFALIDEFQDTDPLQYRIFHSVYGGRADTGLFMIGDPKQAIYSFRGADIFTYMEARQNTDAETGRYTLLRNWRSSTPLVDAVNRLFGGAQAPFLFRDGIEFNAVTAAGSADVGPLCIDGQRPTPIQAWSLQSSPDNTFRGLITKDWARQQVAGLCAGEIVRLLNLGLEGRATLGGAALRARDIAVLVRTHREAGVVQAALRDCGVASVYYSRDSVYASREAEDVARVLRAVVDPGSEHLVRAALATSTLGVGASELDRMGRDEAAWEHQLERFADYQERWRQHGFLAMFLRLLHAERVPARLLPLADGERRLTNLLHLGELLQVVSRELQGPEALLRWLNIQRTSPEGDSEEQQLRLESDEDLVRIVTIHKSKGLEYPLVFLPFPWDSRPSQARAPLLFHPGVGEAPVLDLGSDELDEHARLAERERLAEDLRLLYVAITRAKHRCYLAWGAVNGAASSALGYLLHPELGEAGPSSAKGVDDAAIVQALTRWSGQTPPLVQVVTADEQVIQGVRLRTGKSPDAQPPAARDFTGSIDGSWRITSYSALALEREVSAEPRDHDGAARETAGPPGPTNNRSIFGFPRGARAGEFFHALFEHLDFPEARGEVLAEVVLQQLDRYGFASDWASVVQDAVGEVLDTPLDARGELRLRDLSASRKRAEMEFYYPLALLQANGLRGTLASFANYETVAEGLAFSPLRGLMKGYIDLVFEHEGRFYLLDYKSNHLGDSLADYGSATLASPMHEHRYHLQYLIYAVALHRYLGMRLKDYDYERHFGGVYYLFLRGMRASEGARYGVFHDRPAEALVSALDRLFAGKTDRAYPSVKATDQSVVSGQWPAGRE